VTGSRGDARGEKVDQCSAKTSAEHNAAFGNRTARPIGDLVGTDDKRLRVLRGIGEPPERPISQLRSLGRAPRR
jgi:hypothetical protein